MNFIPRQAAIVAINGKDADFAESTISSFGIEVSRYDSTTSLADDIQSKLVEAGARGVQKPDIAIIVGSTAELADPQSIDIRSLTTMLPVVVTSSSSTVAEAVELMKTGAKDVVELPCEREELCKRVSKTLEASDAESACLDSAVVMRARLELLTPAENAVVDAMLDGLANKQIAQRLRIGLRTVELRRSKIMRKMQAKSVAELVKFICLSGRLRPNAAEAQA